MSIVPFTIVHSTWEFSHPYKEDKVVTNDMIESICNHWLTVCRIDRVLDWKSQLNYLSKTKKKNTKFWTEIYFSSFYLISTKQKIANMINQYRILKMKYYKTYVNVIYTYTKKYETYSCSVNILNNGWIKRSLIITLFFILKGNYTSQICAYRSERI